MRTILITFVLYITAMPVQAADWRKACGNVGDLATDIMKSRQSGLSMAKMMEAVAQVGENPLVDEMIISAYDSPRYSTERMQKRAVEEFRDKFYLDCVKIMKVQK